MWQIICLQKKNFIEMILIYYKLKKASLAQWGAADAWMLKILVFHRRQTVNENGLNVSVCVCVHVCEHVENYYSRAQTQNQV